MKPPPDRFPGESRDPFIRLLSARRVGPGFRACNPIGFFREWLQKMRDWFGLHQKSLGNSVPEYLSQIGICDRKLSDTDENSPPFSDMPIGLHPLSPGKRFYRIASLDHLVSC
jgi:hypothetical protein